MSNERPHLSPKFEGSRFDNHSIPVELLADLAAYRDLVKDVAKDLYKKEHPEQKRVPGAFEAAFKLSLKEISKGSAVAQLVNDIPAEQESNMLEFAPYFDRAKAVVDDTIRSAQDDDAPIPITFPMRLLLNFGRIGKNLKRGEIINFGHGGTKAANFTDSVRKTLVLKASDEVDGPVDEVGMVTGMFNDPDDRLDMKLSDGKTVSGPYFTPSQDDVLEAFKNPKQTCLRIRGRGIFNKQNRLLRFSEIKETEVLDGQDLAWFRALRRLEEMTNLPDGWCSGEGQKFTRESTNWAGMILKTLADTFLIPAPYLFPTPDGQVQLEWEFDNISVDVRLRFSAQDAALFASLQEAEIDELLPLTSPESIAAFGHRLSELIPLMPTT